MKEYEPFKTYMPEIKIPEFKPIILSEIKVYIPKLDTIVKDNFEENFQEKRREDERREINRRLSTYHL